jgi:hypothetical protein
VTASTSNLELLSSTTTVLLSTSIGLQQTFSHSLDFRLRFPTLLEEFALSKAEIPEHQDTN